MDFISIPLVVGIVTWGIYSLFELFARRKERLSIIDKIGDKLDPTAFNAQLNLPKFNQSSKSFGALKIACLLLGIGLGLLVAFFIVNYYFGAISGNYSNHYYDAREIIYGSCTLLFGGLGLLISFIVETQLSKKDR